MEILIFLSLSRSQSIFDRILFFSIRRKRNERPRCRPRFPSFFFLTRSSEREREKGGWKAGALARHPEIQGSSNKLEPWTERKARRARFHARFPFLYLPRLHIRACRNNRQPLLRFKGIILQTFSSLSLSFSFHAELASEWRKGGYRGERFNGRVVSETTLLKY